MKWNLVVLSAIVTHYIESLWSIVIGGRLFCSALGTTLGRHHIALVKHLLFLFSEQKDLLALHTRDLNIRHR
jgi:hypothetical protein